MNVLIVHAHHEPKSFSSALFRQATDTLAAAGHTVTTSDLYALNFDPVSDRRNFTSVKDSDFLKQQQEELHATAAHAFASDVDAEMVKLEACDLLVFNFPLWWFGMPAIMKGWVDRVFAMGRIYGQGKLYEGGLGGGTRRGLCVITTGGIPPAYDGRGVNPALDALLVPVHHGVFWFNGFRPLEPFVAWAPARASAEERAAMLQSFTDRLDRVTDETPQMLPPLADFPDFGHDRLRRFAVTITSPARWSAAAAATPLKRAGVVVAAYDGLADEGSSDPAVRSVLVFRAESAARVGGHLATLSLPAGATAEISEVA